MADYHNDSPIENFEDDRYGVTPFAKALAKSLVNIDSPVGTTIALNGPWGSGKSSAVNLIRREIKNLGDKKLNNLGDKKTCRQRLQVLVVPRRRGACSCLSSRVGFDTEG